MTKKIAHIFFNADMRCSHLGFRKIVEEEKIDVTKNDYVIFVNRARNRIKMFCGGLEVLLCYYDSNRVIDPRIIRDLPKYCDGQSIPVKQATRKLLEREFNKRGLKWG